VEQVCAQTSEDCQPLCPEDSLNLLSELVDKSLISTVSSANGRNRYRMLETARQYAHEKLVDEGESQALRTCHLAYYLSLAERLAPKIRGTEQIETLDELELELGNLRLALDWALHTDVDAVLKLAASLQWFWHIRFLWQEGIEWLERGLDLMRKTYPEFLEDQASAISYARALTALSFHRLMQWFEDINIDLMQVEHGLKESERIFRRVNLETHPEVRRYLAWSLLWQVSICHHKGDTERELALSQEALSLFREVGDLHGVGESLQCLAELETDTNRRKQVHLEQLAVEQTSGDIERIAAANLMLGIACFANGDFLECFHTVERSLKMFLQVNNPIGIANGYSMLGWSTFVNGNRPQAIQAYDQAIFHFHNLGFENKTGFTLAIKCLIPLAEGRYEEAARLFEEAWEIYQLSENQKSMEKLLLIRIRLARLDGDVSAARQHAKDLVKRQDMPADDKLQSWVELGHLALQQADLAQAQEYLREGLFALRGSFYSAVYIFDALALLAARQKRYDLAARLFGSRWCRGYANLLSPTEKAWRAGDWTAMRADLGESRFEELYAEGKIMTYEQAVALSEKVLALEVTND
jgi:tetratricopeptide (TPR) repeat protein